MAKRKLKFRVVMGCGECAGMPGWKSVVTPKGNLAVERCSCRKVVEIGKPKSSEVNSMPDRKLASAGRD